MLLLLMPKILSMIKQPKYSVSVFTEIFLGDRKFFKHSTTPKSKYRYIILDFNVVAIIISLNHIDLGVVG